MLAQFKFKKQYNNLLLISSNSSVVFSLTWSIIYWISDIPK